MKFRKAYLRNWKLRNCNVYKKVIDNCKLKSLPSTYPFPDDFAFNGRPAPASKILEC